MMAVQVVDLVQFADHGALQHHAERADRQRRDQQRPPVVDPEIVLQHPSDECAHHEQGAVSEVDDVQHAEDHRQAERQQRVERPVDQSEQELPEQQLRREAEDGEHQACTSGQPPSASGRNACSAGVVATSL